MPRAVIDTTVLYAAAYRRDELHGDAIPILSSVDAGDLPEAVVLDYVLAETLNGLTVHAGHGASVDFLDRLEENPRFHLESLSGAAIATAKAIFRQHEQLSFVDAAIVAHMQSEELGYLYAFDDDFDAVPDIHRLDTATNPYRPS